MLSDFKNEKSALFSFRYYSYYTKKKFRERPGMTVKDFHWVSFIHTLLRGKAFSLL